jgi:SAM-dependent methyltransferase
VTTSLSKSLAKSYLSLFPVELQDYQTQRKPLQRASMEYEDEKNTRGFQVFFDGFTEPLDVRGKRVLDFGCGYGGRTVRYAELGAASITGIEILTEMVEEARAFAASKGIAANFLEACGERLPFEPDSFDVVCSYDVFEHVEDVEQCLNECWRVLAPGGKLYGVFPPYHHPTGGSHLHGYISKSPLPNVFFSGETLMAAATELMDARQQAFRPPPLRRNDPLWGVNGMTIRNFETILRRLKFSSMQVAYTPLLSPMRSGWHRWKMRYYSFPFRAATKVPLLNEIFTERIVLVMTK